MPRTLWRYVLVDVAVHALLGLLALSVLIAVGNVLRFLEDVAGTGVAFSVLGRLLLAILPTFLCYSIPTALVFGVLITFGRMGSDGELIALRSSGIGVTQMLPPVLVLGVAAALVTAYLMAEVSPRSYARMKQIARDLSQSLSLLDPGEFRELAGRVLFFQSAGGPDCPLRGVVISGNETDKDFVIAGACGEVASENAGSRVVFRLRDGSIHLAEESGDNYRLVHFDTLEMPLEVPEGVVSRRWPDEFTTLELAEIEARGDKPKEWLHSLWIELYGRVAFPVASIVLAIVAVPLGIRPLRSGRSAGALTASALMGLYWLLTSAGQDAADAERLPVIVGIWLPNVLFLGLGLYLLRRSASFEA